MQQTVYSSMYPGDANFLDTVDSYLAKIGVPANIPPHERLAIHEQARNALYSYDVQCIPRIADKILNADMTLDQEARALWIAFSHHTMDPSFVKIMMDYLSSRSDLILNGKIGALLSKVLEEFFKTHAPKNEKQKNSEEATTPEYDEIKHIQIAMEALLGSSASAIQATCGGLSHYEALFIAACLAMNSKETIKEILKSDLSVTANIFDSMMDPDRLVKGALYLLKSEVPSKPSKNQTAFLDSLKRWAFTKLDKIPGGQAVCYQYLVGVYGSVKPDVSPYYIQVKDCGTTYPDLIQVAKQLVNK